MPRVRLTGLGDSSINLEVRGYVLTANYNEFMEIQEKLILEFMNIVEAAGTGFAFPSQTTYLARDTGIDAARKAEIEGDAADPRVEAGSAGDEGEVRSAV